MVHSETVYALLVKQQGQLSSPSISSDVVIWPLATWAICSPILMRFGEIKLHKNFFHQKFIQDFSFCCLAVKTQIDGVNFCSSCSHIFFLHALIKHTHYILHVLDLQIFFFIIMRTLTLFSLPLYNIT